MSIIIPFVLIAVIGGLLGFGLAIADSKLSVKKDEKLTEMENSMPNANCGGCGFAGCSAYAEAVFNHKAEIGLCAPGGNDLAQKMSQIMGIKTEVMDKKVAHVFCSAVPSNVGKDFDYNGLEDCNAATILFKGEKKCKEGCIGFGSCMKVCPEGAIKRTPEGKIYVDVSLCIGCGKCTKACPLQVIRMIPASQKYTVDCNSHEKGPNLRKYCETGCIGCGICEKKCPGSGFTVTSFLASYSEKDSTKEAAQQALACCPRKVIKEV